MLAHAELNAWRVALKPRHALPLLPPHAFLVADQLLRQGLPFVAALLLLQSMTGLRPGEALGLLLDHLVLPGVLPGGGSFAHLLLGPVAGTKAGRPQVVRVDTPFALWLVVRLFFAALPGAAITYLKSLGGYAYLIQRAARAANLTVNWTPHSPRAGFVTWMFLHGLSREKTMTTTRHQSVRSFRVYLDAQAVVAGKLAQELLDRNHEVENLMASLPHRLHAALPFINTRVHVSS